MRENTTCLAQFRGDARDAPWCFGLILKLALEVRAKTWADDWSGCPLLQTQTQPLSSRPTARW
eukprot:4492072-Pyramimonas_sp.AAC.1